MRRFFFFLLIRRRAFHVGLFARRVTYQLFQNNEFGCCWCRFVCWHRFLGETICELKFRGRQARARATSPGLRAYFEIYKYLVGTARSTYPDRYAPQHRRRDHALLQSMHSATNQINPTAPVLTCSEGGGKQISKSAGCKKKCTIYLCRSQYPVQAVSVQMRTIWSTWDGQEKKRNSTIPLWLRSTLFCRSRQGMTTSYEVVSIHGISIGHRY